MPINIVCLGDIMCGENVNHIGRGIRSRFRQDYTKIISSEVRNELIKDVEFVFYNFEYSILSKSHINQTEDSYKKLVYISEPGTIEVFNDSLVRIVNIANNHFSQHGTEIANNTKQLLKKKGFFLVGENRKPTLIEKKGYKVLFWGVSLIKDKYYCNEYFFSSFESILDELQLTKKGEKDIWVISIHWGDEYISKPSKQQTKLAHRLIDKGFDLIIGHHPHVIQPIEIYNDKTIIYSLGNFIFDQDFSKTTQRGLAVKMQISETNFKILKTYITKQNNYIVSSIGNGSKYINSNRKPLFYKLILSFERTKARGLMKFEVLINYKRLSHFTKNYYLSKIRDRIKLGNNKYR